MDMPQLPNTLTQHSFSHRQAVTWLMIVECLGPAKSGVHHPKAPTPPPQLLRRDASEMLPWKKSVDTATIETGLGRVDT
ncbi:hypothetical protein MY1884_002882 [Beauveria asiatica]